MSNAPGHPIETSGPSMGKQTPPFIIPGVGGAAAIPPMGGGLLSGASPPPLPDVAPLIQAPNKDSQSSKALHALLVLVPGAFLFPKDYSTLLTAFKSTSFQSKGINLWVAVAGIQWASLSPASFADLPQVVAAASETAVEAAVEQGFPVNSTRTGRYTNVFSAMHSMTCIGAKEFPLKRATATILLGGNLIGADNFWPSPHTFPRPLLQVYGRLDGQTSLAGAALSIADAATAAPNIGFPAVAIKNPVALIPECNHSFFSNGVLNTMRGDITCDQPQEAAAAKIAEVCTAFINVHSPGVELEVLTNGTMVLMDSTKSTAEIVSPYVRALGRVAPEDLLFGSRNSSSSLTGTFINSKSNTRALTLASGAEMAIPFNPLSSMIAHPGELHAAECFAITAQKRLLTAVFGANSPLLESIAITATVHTQPDTFTYSQSVLLPPVISCEGAPWTLEVQCLIEKEQHKGAAPPAATSPMYGLKLKSGVQVAASLKAAEIVVDSQMVQEGEEGERKEELTAAQINSDTLEEARKLLPIEIRELFEKRGRNLVFTDNDLTGKARPAEWVRMHIKVENTKETDHATAIAPCITTPVEEGVLDEESAHFAGACYMKCPSLAWAMDWFMTGGLREPSVAVPVEEEGGQGMGMGRGGPPPGVVAAMAGRGGGIRPPFA